MMWRTTEQTQAFVASLDSLHLRALLASIEASAGASSAIKIWTLNAEGSLLLTGAGVAAHATELAECRRRVEMCSLLS
jgi:hypothetical protein